MKMPEQLGLQTDVQEHLDGWWCDWGGLGFTSLGPGASLSSNFNHREFSKLKNEPCAWTCARKRAHRSRHMVL